MFRRPGLNPKIKKEREAESEYLFHRGTLEIPHGAKIYRSEPAVIMTTKPDTKFYYPEPLSGVAKFDPKDPKDQERMVEDDKLKGAAVTGLVRPFVETWQYQEGQTESPPLQLDTLRQLLVQSRSGGFRCVYAQDLVDPDEKQTVVFKKLFPTQPSKVQIRQQDTIGNCFLLAPIMAISSQKNGYEFILNSMKQLEDGTTIVRLFDPKTLRPVYVQVTNSTMVQNGKEVVSHEAPWVHILEKAYVAFHGLQQHDFQKKSIYLFPTFESEVVNSVIALRILTGQIIEYMILPNPYRNELTDENQGHTDSQHEFQIKREQQYKAPFRVAPEAPTKWFGKSNTEEHVFNYLQNKLVIAGTLNKLPEIKEAAGLKKQHAYAVIRVYKKQGEMMICLRNPWGDAGQLTDSKGNKKADFDIPEFEMSIRDFMKIFSTVTVGSLPKPPPAPVLQNPPAPGKSKSS